MAVRMDMELSANIIMFGMMPLPATPMNNSRSSLNLGAVWPLPNTANMKTRAKQIIPFFKFMFLSLISDGHAGIYPGFDFGVSTLAVDRNLRGYRNIPDDRAYA